MAIFDKLNRKGVFKRNNPKVTNIHIGKEDKLYRLINVSKWEKLLNNKSVDLAKEIKNTANRILHLKNEKVSVSKKVAFEVITNTVRVVEYLYR